MGGSLNTVKAFDLFGPNGSWTFLAYVLMALVLFLPGTDLTGRNGRKPMTWTQTQNALYITFARPLWALGNLVIVMGCYFGYLPWTNIFLGHSFFNPLQKLTLGASLPSRNHQDSFWKRQ